MIQKIALGAVVLALVPAVASAKTPKRRAVAQEQQIACTVLGCAPVPASCRPGTGYGRNGAPTGFDVVVCPPGVAPIK